jgi:hypothetical protein
MWQPNDDEQVIMVTMWRVLITCPSWSVESRQPSLVGGRERWGAPASYTINGIRALRLYDALVRDYGSPEWARITVGRGKDERCLDALGVSVLRRAVEAGPLTVTEMAETLKAAKSP